MIAAPAQIVIMVRPAVFGYNKQTAATNIFQQPPVSTGPSVQRQAFGEFEAMVRLLRQHGIQVLVFQQNNPHCPDAVFPNNWFSVFPDRIILYPLEAANRRAERRPDWIRFVAPRRSIVDLTQAELSGQYLEGTGSLVADHQHRRVYAARSSRTHDVLAELWSQYMEYELILFDAHTADQRPIYHTNVLLSIGERMAVLCTEVVAAKDRECVVKKLSEHHRLVTITEKQLFAFCANIFLLRNYRQQRFWIMSEQAFQKLNPMQIDDLRMDGSLLYCPLATIERMGGGSARCLLAELYE